MPLLRVSNAAATYGKHMALAEVDLHIDGGPQQPRAVQHPSGGHSDQT